MSQIRGGQKVRFQQTGDHGLLQLFLTVSWDLLAYRGTPDGALDSLKFRKQRTRQVEALEGRRVSSKIPSRISETETRELLGGTEENSVFPMRGH